MSKEELAVAKEKLEQVSRLSAKAQELIDTYAEGVMAGLRIRTQEQKQEEQHGN